MRLLSSSASISLPSCHCLMFSFIPYLNQSNPVSNTFYCSFPLWETIVDPMHVNCLEYSLVESSGIYHNVSQRPSGPWWFQYKIKSNKLLLCMRPENMHFSIIFNVCFTHANPRKHTNPYWIILNLSCPDHTTLAAG